MPSLSRGISQTNCQARKRTVEIHNIEEYSRCAGDVADVEYRHPVGFHSHNAVVQQPPLCKGKHDQRNHDPALALPYRDATAKAVGEIQSRLAKVTATYVRNIRQVDDAAMALLAAH